VVNKYIVTLLLLDKTITFSVTKPFDNSIRQKVAFLSAKKLKQNIASEISCRSIAF